MIFYCNIHKSKFQIRAVPANASHHAPRLSPSCWLLRTCGVAKVANNNKTQYEMCALSVQAFFYRRRSATIFMIAVRQRQYDIVTSAFSLFELDSTESRLQTLHNLWGKTRNYLVLIEQGTQAAFKLIDEAKEFIMYLSKSQDEAYILAPCPHEEACPRMQAQDGTPCNFEIRYPPYLKRSGTYVNERYCYVIIGKGRRPETVPAWPRIVRPTIVRRRHTICRLCTS
ncbi:hypothetical protein B566_EDAN007786, partial [Ephemera danica]